MNTRVENSASEPRKTIDTVLCPVIVLPECKHQAVCTNGAKCWEAGLCLKAKPDRPQSDSRCTVATEQTEGPMNETTEAATLDPAPDMEGSGAVTAVGRSDTGEPEPTPSRLVAVELWMHCTEQKRKESRPEDHVWVIVELPLDTITTDAMSYAMTKAIQTDRRYRNWWIGTIVNVEDSVVLVAKP